MEPWIETYTGKKFDLLNPQPEQICIEDIAHALSQQCRFTGHTRWFYSVAEHSWHVSILSKGNSLWGLLHDASEAYLSDLSRPVKQCTPVGIPYRETEKRIMDAICSRFGLPLEMPAEVHTGDNVMLFTEKGGLMTDLSWGDDPSSNMLIEKGRADIRLHCWLPQEAERNFLDRFDFLTGEL